MVDNGSTDATREVVSKLGEEIANLRCVHEPNDGLSNARNGEIKVETDEAVAYMDDDALGKDWWLDRLWSV